MSSQDWQTEFLNKFPLFEPLTIFADDLKKFSDWPDLTDIDNLINGSNKKKIVTCSGKSIGFVTPVKSAGEFSQQYEVRIYQTGEVQTRLNNWHDFFNAMVWGIFPKTKAQLNQLHYQALTQEWQTEKKQRGPYRDTLTLFDESGVVVVCSDARLIKLLNNFEWKALFWKYRKIMLNHMKFFIFGHGLYEKGLNPYIGMTGKGIVLSVVDDFFDQSLLAQLHTIDLMLAEFVRCHLVKTTDLTPVPVLGYPGWSAANMDEVYYNNRQYFRSRPAQR